MPENRFTQLAKEADAAFDGLYKNELNALCGLSRAEIDSITPDSEDMRVYSALMKVVETASRNNLSQARLVQDIKELGGVAVQIAKKTPFLSSFV